NRYYVSSEAAELAQRFDVDIEAIETTTQFRNFKPAIADTTHPDQRLAMLLTANSMLRLPLLPPDVLFQILTADVPAANLVQPASESSIDMAIARVLGPDAKPALEELDLPEAPRLRDVYFAIINTDQFRAACGRISA